MQPKSHINAANFSSAAFSLDEDTDSPLIDYNQGNYLFRVENAHQDDVHAVVKAGTSILTGSKDCSVKIWSPDLKLLETKDERQNVNYKEWVTALFHLGNGEWVYGNRSGQLFKYNCEHQLENQAKIWVSKHVSKARNLNRISCLSAIYSTNNTVSKLLVGVAKSIQVWHVNENLKFIYKVDVSENDWVYCIEPLQNNKFFVVIGCNLEVWENVQMQGQKKWSLECIAKVHNEIIKERFFNEDKRQRPFISAIECINNETLGMVDFSSRVKWIDLERGELLYNKKVHTGRIWSIKKLDDHSYATSADDRTVKIWDARQAGLVKTYANHTGRVSNLQPMDAHTLLACSCPDDVLENEEKASFTLWDLRI